MSRSTVLNSSIKSRIISLRKDNVLISDIVSQTGIAITQVREILRAAGMTKSRNATIETVFDFDHDQGGNQHRRYEMFSRNYDKFVASKNELQVGRV